MIDTTDKKIICIIQFNGNISYKDIGKKVGLSTSAVNERLKRLKSEGVIKKHVALINPVSLGLDVCAFVQVLIEAPETEEEFLNIMRQLDEVQECHCITGEYSYLLKVRTESTLKLEELLREKIKTIKGVVRTDTVIALTSPKEEVNIPIPTEENSSK